MSPAPSDALADVGLRPATAADDAFLRTVFASVREQELAPLGWGGAQRAAFLAQQFAAQDAAYRQRFPDGDFLVVERGGAPVGRLLLGRLPGETRVLDVALLPAHRGQGIGTALLSDVLAAADDRRERVSLHVERWNPAQRLYARLGFRAVGGDEVYLLLERPARRPAS